MVTTANSARGFLCVCLAAAGCQVPGAVLHVASSVAPAPSAYCISLSAGGTRRYGHRYSVSDSPFPQTLGVKADGQSMMRARIDGLIGGLRTSSSAQDFPLSGVPELSLASCTPAVAGPFALRTSIPRSLGHVAFVHTGIEAARASSFVAVSAANAIIGRYGDDGTLVTGTGPMPGGSGSPAALAVLDLDGDCADDVLVATSGNTIGNPVAAWSSQASGIYVDDGDRFGDEQSEARGLALGDIDGDGWADVVKVGVNGGVVLLSNHTTGFSAVVDAFDPPPEGSTAAAIGDLDGDGLTDVLVGFTSSKLQWWKGAGDGGLSIQPVLPSGAQAAQVLLRDLDGDGDLDVLAATASGLRVYTNDGHGTFADVTTTWVDFALDPNIVALSIADVDGDCIDDLLVAGTTSAPHLVALGTAKLKDIGAIGNNAARDVGAADLDGDGLPEVVVIGASSVDIFSTTGAAK